MKSESHSCDGLLFDNGTGLVTTDHLIPVPVKLSRCYERLVITHCGNYGESQLILTPEQEVEFWKQVIEVIDETTANKAWAEANYRTNLAKKRI